MASSTENTDTDGAQVQENKDTLKTRQEPTASLNLSKRKKEIENQREGHPELKEIDMDVEFLQTDTDLKILLNIDLKPEQLNGVDPTITDTDAHLKFPDGQTWSCNFFRHVQGDSCRLYFKNRQLVLHAKKKEAGHWVSYMIPNSIPDEDVRDNRKAEEKLDLEIPGNSSDNAESPQEEKGAKETMGKSSPSEDTTNINSSAYQLQHTKHDWIEKENLIVVHIYVKEARRDGIQIYFDVQTLSVLFQTSNSKFLQLHAGTDENTIFSWEVKLKNEIDPSKSKFRITQTMIEVSLSKKIPQRWNTLEAPQRKDSWISTGKIPSSSGQEAKACSGSQSSVMFDELSTVSTTKKGDYADNRTMEACKGATGVSQPVRDLNSQKPTCKVSPMNKAKEMEQVVSPGNTGLDNLGNTCFMNSVLQSLANTREFRDFFYSGAYQKDINTDNPLGSGGKLAVQFAHLLKVLWSGKHYSYAPSKLKNLVAMKASQFTGFAQHDAQEFMAFLLDGLHEDLNRVKEKPYTETVDSDGKSDETVAREAWDVYKKRNDSFIVDLFQGQYKSKLVCPVCGKVSITFDPFLYLSVPLPKKKRQLPVIFMWRDPYKKPVQLLLWLAKECTTDMVKEAASKKTGVKPRDMRIIEAYKSKIYKYYSSESDWSNVQASDSIIIGEVLSEEVAGEPVYEVYVVQRTILPNTAPTHCASCKRLCPDGSKLKRCTKCYKVGYCDRKCQRDHWNLHRTNCKPTPEPVGCPYILSIPESRTTFSRLCTLMEASARYSVDVFQPPVKPDASGKLSSQSSTSSSLSSSSSQSSGSMNSLDSQSSISSTCTITAGQDQTDCGDTDLTASSSSVTTGVESGEEMADISQYLQANVEGDHMNINPTDTDIPLNPGQSDESVNERNLPEYPSFKLPQSDYADMTREAEIGGEEEDMEDGRGSRPTPTNSVLGIKSDDMDRVSPLFFIKPVNQEGLGIKGPDGERLEDKGDVPLDLSYRQFLSIDWKNNDKFSPYALVQTKELDCEEDPSMQASVDENSNITITQCLDLFTEPEVLSPEEAWYCPRCKEHREATKQMSIWRLPHTLIIQLKRFSFRNFIWRDKIDKMVDFPVRGFDLSQFYIGAQPKNEPPPVYDLYAVVNHYGGILGGHYTAFVRCADLTDSSKNDVDWRLCDDSRVSSVSNEKNQVVTRGAYLLFYRRRDTFSIPKEMSSGQDTENKAEEETPQTDPSFSGETNTVDNTIGIDSTDSGNTAASGNVTEATPLLDNRYSDPKNGDTYPEDSDKENVDCDGEQTGVQENTYRPPVDLGYMDMEAVD
ncbi:ubiquitin carboxyl-terminal hydrolase 19-like isoform X2 [Mizuhopecten yessoensis]|uniref:ubiquitin carboxyl-terminal hydrolase 19-like isoform X2 n=1 Tax=Mizuhopecten yessoensis TaxID=6573 RepID=UPI000B45F318|nr:ubiquitin carboxyl-terminal hydrolase 19-like isoform X2 [Mizuhopecten yessoensis]